MKKYTGIWVDHKKAVIVTKKQPEGLYEEDVELAVTQISSDVEKKIRLAGGSRTRNTPYGPQDIAVDSKMETRQKQQLKKFYHRIIDCITDADKILIMGPGEAKSELKKEIEKLKALIPKIVGVHSSDKMTTKQVAAKVKSYFGQT